MKLAVGGIDRVVRIVVGVLVLAAGFLTRSWWVAIGFVPLVTAAIGGCPACLPFGLSTCKTGPTTAS